ncbi:hypothetical protein [Kitasatospora herbaricolor]|uniref:hypothetical protein n=1 Tax=Kitasatospora herbaricolor TaxID=68217 RepID=UPI0036D9534C
MTFPAGHGYDLGLLEGGRAAGVIVIPPGSHYQTTATWSDHPAPGNTWFLLDTVPSQG